MLQISCSYLKRVATVVAAHGVLHPGLVVEPRAVPGEFLRGHLKSKLCYIFNGRVL